MTPRPGGSKESVGGGVAASKAVEVPRPGSKESTGVGGSREVLLAPSPPGSGVEDTKRAVLAEQKRAVHAKELEKRYPGDRHATTSSEEVKSEKGRRAKNALKAAVPLPPHKKRLIQVSCDEVGRISRALENEQYYHGFMTRNEADKLLKRDGEFLVRRTEVGGQLHYVLSVFYGGSVCNYLIKRTNRKRLYWVYRFAFKTVSDLIQYHYRNREPIGTEGHLLLKPLMKQDWQLNNEQVERKDKLGEGAFGEVWKGSLQISPFLPRVDVAVKTLHSGSLNGDERIKFLKEANLMLNLNHTNVVKLYGVCTAKEPIMIVMELAPGGSLLEKCKDQATPPTMTEKLNFVFGGAKGMAYLEGKKIIHRDIAARNCLLGAKQEVKISDFGLSMLGNEFREKKMKNVPLRWLAPETLKRGRYSSKSDVYSFGVMIFEVYSGGKEPYEGVENKLLRKMVVEKSITLDLAEEIQEEMEVLRKRCMAYEAEERPTFRELEESIGAMPEAYHPPPPSFWSKLGGRIKRWLAKI